MYRVALAIAAPLMAFMLSVVTPASANAMEAYIFRGAGDFSFIAKGLTFSDGMDRLGEEFEKIGVHATVYRWESMEFAYRDIMRRHPDSVAIMGHSMGALASISLAAKLKGSGIRVAYMGLIDIPGPGALAPSNVEVAENYYHAFPVYGQLAAGKGFNGKIRNQYVWGEIHVSMDNSKKIHTAMLDAVKLKLGPSDATVMQAYAPDAAGGGSGGGNLVAKVDKLLTGSTAQSTSAATSAPVVVAASTSEFVRAAPSTPSGQGSASGQSPASTLTVAMALPAIGPMPTRAPRRYDTRTGLPPIE